MGSISQSYAIYDVIMPSSLSAANFVETPPMVVQHPLSNAVSYCDTEEYMDEFDPDTGFRRRVRYHR